MKEKLERFCYNEIKSKIVRIMRLTLFLILVSTIITCSSESYSQNAIFTIKEDNVTVKDVLNTIEEQSEFLFIYQESQLNHSRTVKIMEEGVAVDVVLDKLFAGTDNIYSINDRQITIGVRESTIEEMTSLLEKKVVPILQVPQVKNPGTVEGIIKDGETGEVLPFCNVYIIGTAHGCITDKNGFYSIKNITPGNYKLTASFIGYMETTIAVDIIPDQRVTCDFQLQIVSVQGEEVIITAQALGQAKAINTQINAQNIKNVVSETKIRELPDANVAEALSRLPGVSIIRSGGEAVEVKIRGVSENSVYVNGIPLGGGLVSVSSSMLGSIEVSKAFMPDQDADVLGGEIDLKMREARPGFKKELWLSTGYNGFTKSFKMQNASLLLSNRFFNDKLGIMFSFNYDRKDRGRDNLSAGYTTIGSSPNSEFLLPFELKSVELTHSENLNNRYGITIYADYKLQNGKIFYNGFYSRLNEQFKSSSNSYAGRLDYVSNQGNSTSCNIINGFGGEHTIWGVKIDWGISYSDAKYNSPKNYYFDATEWGGMSNMSLVDTSTTINQFMDLADNDLNLTAAGRIETNNTKSHSNELGYRFNFEIPFKIKNKVDGHIKFGGKIRNINRGFDHNLLYSDFSNTGALRLHDDAAERLPDYGWTYTPDKMLGVEAFLGNEWSNDFSMYGLKTYYFPDFEKIKYLTSVLGDLYIPTRNMDQNDYTNNEQFYAGYIMAELNYGKLITFIPGIRYEKNQYSTTARYLQEIRQYGPLPTQGDLRDTTNGTFNGNFFPMMHLKIKPLNWFDIRLAYTETVSRPNFYVMSPRYYRSPYFDLNMGNVFLNPQKNYNYDLYLSFYTKKLGLFTAGIFYKKMEEQVMDYQILILDPVLYNLPSGYKNKSLQKPINNQWPGYIQGLEFDWQTHFSYLKKPFNGIVLNANLTLMQSETRYPFFSFETVDVVDENGKPIPPYRITEGKHDSRLSKITGMPDVIGNIVLGYEIAGFSGRVSSYYQSATLTHAQQSNITLDAAKASLLRFDLQLSQTIKKVKGLSFYLNINNLTNNPDKVVLNHFQDHIISEERYGTSGDIGCRYKF